MTELRYFSGLLARLFSYNKPMKISMFKPVYRLLRNSPLLLLLVLLLATSPALAADIKVGVVNAAKVMEDAPQAEAARKRLEQEFAPRDKKLVAAQKAIRQLEEKLERDGSIMSDRERMKVERDLGAQRRDIRREQEAFREDFNMRRNEELGKLQRQVSEVIVKLAREKGFDLILTDGVLYASDKVDITELVLKRLQSGATGK